MTLAKALFIVVLAISGVALLLFTLERIESLIRSHLPKASKLLFNSWAQLHAIALVAIVAACLTNMARHPVPTGLEFLIIPLVSAFLVYAAPLAFILIAAAHNPDMILALAQTGYRSARRRVSRWLCGSTSDKGA